MGGFATIDKTGTGVSGTTVYADNVDFSGNRNRTVTTNGQLMIGSTAQPNIQIGQLTSPDSSITIGYSSPNITLSVTAGPTVVTKLAPQTGTNPVVPAAGIITVSGAVVAAGTNPIRTDGTAASTLTIEVQTSQALAAADATKIGLSNFDSSSFSVAATGFVTLSSTGAGKTITGDSGGALSPTSNNWNILGRAGSKTAGSGSTLTISSPPFSQVSTTSTSVLNSGEFVTAAVTRTLPATAGLVDGDLVIYCTNTSNALTVTANTGQTIRLGNVVSASGGTAVSTAAGDSLTLRFDATAISWQAVSSIGNWVVT
jgi:hypothetical protein